MCCRGSWFSKSGSIESILMLDLASKKRIKVSNRRDLYSTILISKTRWPLVRTASPYSAILSSRANLAAPDPDFHYSIEIRTSASSFKQEELRKLPVTAVYLFEASRSPMIAEYLRAWSPRDSTNSGF